MDRNKRLRILSRSQQRGFALAEVGVALFVVTLVIVLVGAIGQQVGIFSKKSKQAAAVMEIRARTAAIIKDQAAWLDELRFMPTNASGTEAIFGSCLPPESSPASGYTCPTTVLTSLPDDINEMTKVGTTLGVYKAMDTKLIDAAEEIVAGTLAGADAHYLSDDGATCIPVDDEATNCSLQSIGYFLRENASGGFPGRVKFAVKIETNSHYKGTRVTPMKAQVAKIDLGLDWKVSDAEGCTLPAVQVGINSSKKPICMNPTTPCTGGTVGVGIDNSGAPICKAVPVCSGATPKAVLNTASNDFECATTSPCPGSTQAFLGYYTSSGQAMCSDPGAGCPTGQLQMGASITGSTLTPICKSMPVPPCTSTEEIAYDGSVFKCVASNNAGGKCPVGEVVVEITASGNPICGPAGGASSSTATTLTVPPCAAGSVLTSSSTGGLKCVDPLPNCAPKQIIAKKAVGEGYYCTDADTAAGIPKCLPGQMIVVANSGDGYKCAESPFDKSSVRLRTAPKTCYCADDEIRTGCAGIQHDSWDIYAIDNGCEGQDTDTVQCICLKFK